MTASAPGKAILFGEHAVVYGRPAIAVPLHALRARAAVEAAEGSESGRLWIEAPDIGFSGWVDLADASSGQVTAVGEGSTAVRAPASEVAGLVLAVRLALEHFGVDKPPALRLRLQSDLPSASGMGSSAAVTVAILRAVAAHLGQTLSAETASELAFEVEKHYHGTPSGIDNAVVATGAPIYFVRGRPPQVIPVGTKFALAVADCGEPSPTRELVAGVRSRWQADQQAYEGLFDRIGAIVERARTAIETGRVSQLGELMNQNQQLLEAIGVSSPALERLIEVARKAGAQGAKLSGAGGGGVVIAIGQPQVMPQLQQALPAAGASRVVITEVR